MGLFSASGSCWHEPLLQLWISSVANPFSFEVRTWLKSFSLSECPVFGKPGGRASVGELPDQFRYTYDGGGRGGRGKGGKARAPSLKDTTVIEKSVSLGIFIRKTVRSPHGPAEFRCFKCGSTQHKVDNCLADEDTVTKWVDEAEPAP